MNHEAHIIMGDKIIYFEMDEKEDVLRVSEHEIQDDDAPFIRGYDFTLEEVYEALKDRLEK